MDAHQKNIQCAERVKMYLNSGSDILEGVFIDGNLTGLFPSKVSIPRKYLDATGCSIIPISVAKMNPTNWDMKFAINRPTIVSKCNRIFDEHTRSTHSTLGWLEVLFLFCMQNPDLIARYAGFRKMFNEKTVQFKEDLTGRFKDRFHQSKIILEDAPAFLKNIYKNIHYTEVFVPTTSSPLPKYNLRRRKYINYAEMNG